MMQVHQHRESAHALCAPRVETFKGQELHPIVWDAVERIHGGLFSEGVLNSSARLT